VFYLLEQSVLEVEMEDHLPEMAWSIFDDSPVVRAFGQEVTVGDREWVLFAFDEFELLLPPECVTALEQPV